MTHERQIELASTRVGRVALHLHALWRDHHLFWHLRCMLREFALR